MTKQKFAYLKEVAYLALGEIIVSLLTIGGFLLVQAIFSGSDIFDYTVITGALLGTVVVLINFFILSIAVTRAVLRYIQERGDKDMTEEEAEAFAEEHEGRVKLAVARSYIVRTLLTLGTLIIAFVLEWFDPIATVIPLLMYKPVLIASNYIKTIKMKCLLEKKIIFIIISFLKMGEE